jgi:hypothetical protein
MGYHSFKDNMFCSFQGFKLGLSGKKFFSANIESPYLPECYESVSVAIPQISKIGVYPLKASTPSGTVQPVIHVLQWKGEGFPVIVYHHWSNEHPIDSSCRKIFMQPKHPFNANIILVQAAYHGAGEFSLATRDLSLFTTMAAVSVRVVDELVKQFSERKMPVIVCGLKLGGWVANFHHAVSDSAYAYIPLLAGAGFGDIFIDSPFSKCVSAKARRNHQKVRRALNFDDLFMSRHHHKNVFPLLARYDRIAQPTRQIPAFGDMKIPLMNKGHISGASAFSLMRKHCAAVIDRIKR